MKVFVQPRPSVFQVWPFAWLRPRPGADQPVSFTDRRALVRQRRDLARLDPHLLRDIGVSAHDATVEARRAIWDVPAHWRQKP